MNFFSEFAARWSASAPSFFHKIQDIAAWLVATGLALIGVPAIIEKLVPGYNFDLSLLGTIASYMILAGTIAGVVAKLPVKDVKDIK